MGLPDQEMKADDASRLVARITISLSPVNRTLFIAHVALLLPKIGADAEPGSDRRHAVLVEEFPLQV